MTGILGTRAVKNVGDLGAAIVSHVKICIDIHDDSVIGYPYE